MEEAPRRGQPEPPGGHERPEGAPQRPDAEVGEEIRADAAGRGTTRKKEADGRKESGRREEETL